MPPQDRKKFTKGRTIGLVLLGMFLFTVAIVWFSTLQYGEPYLRDTIEQEANRLLNPRAELVIGDLSIGYLPPSVTLRNIQIGPSGRLQDSRTSAIEMIRISGIAPGKLIFGSDLSAGSVQISGADLHIFPDYIANLTSSSNSDKDKSKLFISEASITDSDVSFYRPGETMAHTVINSVEMTVDQLDLSPDSQSRTDMTKNTNIAAASVMHELQSGHYKIEADSIRFNQQAGTLELSRFGLIPHYTPQRLSERMGHEIDHLDIATGGIQVHGFEADRWLTENELTATAFDINELQLKVSRDKNFSEQPRAEKKLLNELFANLSYAVMLDTLRLHNGSVAYREMKAGQDQYGEILFDLIGATITNIQNRDAGSGIRADVSSRVMSEAELEVNFEFFPVSNGLHYVSGRLESTDLRTFNSVIEPLAFIRIDEGLLESMTFQFKADHENASGELTVLYDGLKLKKLSEETLEETGRGKLVSFFANLVAVRSSNNGENPRIGVIDFEREKDKSTFSYWWKSLKSGLESAVMRM